MAAEQLSPAQRVAIRLAPAPMTPAEAREILYPPPHPSSTRPSAPQPHSTNHRALQQAISAEIANLAAIEHIPGVLGDAYNRRRHVEVQAQLRRFMEALAGEQLVQGRGVAAARPYVYRREEEQQFADDLDEFLMFENERMEQLQDEIDDFCMAENERMEQLQDEIDDCIYG
ncbi:hypothetical protein EDC01DRAFT_29129 [Geopyxis carbonaria]|nr:hypothetical protein EDC01DRAFT_29129 [Geopyxis carbonaria]